MLTMHQTWLANVCWKYLAAIFRMLLWRRRP